MKDECDDEKEKEEKFVLDFSPPKVTSRSQVWAYNFEKSRFLKEILQK